MKTSFVLLLLCLLAALCPSASGQAWVTWSGPSCSYGESSMSTPGPIGCFAQCGCADEWYEWTNSVVVQAGWDCTVNPATGYVSAGPDGSGVSGVGTLTAGSVLDGTYSAQFGTYMNSCDGMFFDSGLLYDGDC